MIAFVKARKIVLWVEFSTVVLLVLALFIADHFWHFGESLGWMMLFGSIPWSAMALAVPQMGVFAVAVIAVGLGFNTVVITIVVWYAIAWWLNTFRFRNDA